MSYTAHFVHILILQCTIGLPPVHYRTDRDSEFEKDPSRPTITVELVFAKNKKNEYKNSRILIFLHFEFPDISWKPIITNDPYFWETIYINLLPKNL